MGDVRTCVFCELISAGERVGRVGWLLLFFYFLIRFKKGGEDLILGGLVVASLLWFVPVALRVTGPESEVVTQQLHYQGGIFVAVLVEGVQFGDRVVECLGKIFNID